MVMMINQDFGVVLAPKRSMKDYRYQKKGDVIITRNV